MELFAKKKEPQICHKWLSLVRIVVLSAEEVKVGWNLELAAKLAVDGPAMAVKLLESDRNAAQVIVWG